MGHVVAYLFKCPHCGHNNLSARTILESLKMWQEDRLPPCKICSRKLEKSRFRPPDHIINRFLGRQETAAPQK